MWTERFGNYDCLVLSLDVIYCRNCYFTGLFPRILTSNCSDFLDKLAKIPQKGLKKVAYFGEKVKDQKVRAIHNI